MKTTPHSATAIAQPNLAFTKCSRSKPRYLDDAGAAGRDTKAGRTNFVSGRTFLANSQCHLIEGVNSP